MSVKIPLGIEDFRKLREEDYYYIDKTPLIKGLLDRQFEATLITRPRRFGKTLTMSMLEDFFDISRDSRSDFEGLAISKETELCREWMNQWPVIFLTLKWAEGLDFDGAYGMLAEIISIFCKRHEFLATSKAVDSDDKKAFLALKAKEAGEQTVKSSLLLLSRMMAAHYGKPVILLIDEYDVPLAKASENGYYEQMMDIIRAMLSGALKTNPDLKFAVVTGCLRISKESIFTGLNNLVVDDISGNGFRDAIGFSPDEVSKLLADAKLADHAELVQQWYDGYRFGAAEIYCPWAVLSYVNDLQSNASAKPRDYWANTSHNGVIYHFIDRSDLDVNDKFETLMAGRMLITPVVENLTYDMIHSTEENLWSLLYLTGYLTEADPEQVKVPLERGVMALRIPNEEVKSIFASTIIAWFNDTIQTEDRKNLFAALWSGDAEKAQEILSDLLFETISYYDYKESYYHAFLTGLLTGSGYAVGSNYEYGDGRPDIVVKDRKHRRAIVLEVKRAKQEKDVPSKCREALNQIRDERYLEGIEKGYRTKLGYGVVFCEKDCFVVRFEG